MYKLDDILLTITGAFALGAILTFFVTKSIYEKPAPAEVKSSVVSDGASCSTAGALCSSTTATSITFETNPHHLPSGFYLEYDQANNRYRYCEPWPWGCDLFTNETKEAAAESARDMVRFRERKAKAKWEKVKP